MNAKFVFAPVALLLTVSHCFAADVADGKILAYDRKAEVLVFTDKTVWALETLQTAAPADLKAGDRVEITYESNEDDGVTAIHSIVAVPK